MIGNHLYFEAAERIGFKLVRDALWDGGRSTWLAWSTVTIDHRNGIGIKSLGCNLYDGTVGIGLFLAELFRINPNPHVKRTIEGCVNHTLSLMEKSSLRCSFYDGYVGILYALARISEILEHPKLDAFVQKNLREILQFQPISSQLDLIAGSAGAIPVWLYLSKKYGNAELVSLAVEHGDYLIAQALATEFGWCWNTINSSTECQLTGFAHGIAGISTALLELYHWTGENRFRDAALAGLRYEDHLFDFDHGNWPDLRGVPISNDASATEDRSTLSFGMAWCHGAPGIGLARMRCSELLSNEVIARDRDIAVSKTCSALNSSWTPTSDNFSLCHGRSGNTELLLQMSRYHGRQDLDELINAVALEGVNAFSITDIPWPCGVRHAGETPSLMLGTSGIGHFYLQLFDADVPSVLLIAPNKPALVSG